MTTTNRQVTLAQHPVGLPDGTTWRIIDTPTTAPGPGQLVVAILYLSVDPAMRQWIDPDRGEESGAVVPRCPGR